MRMFFRHPVVDFATWKVAYDSFDAERPGFGVTAHACYQAADDPDDVTGWHDFETLEAAQVFDGSVRLREVMEGAGVAGAPDIWFTIPA